MTVSKWFFFAQLEFVTYEHYNKGFFRLSIIIYDRLQVFNDYRNTWLSSEIKSWSIIELSGQQRNVFFDCDRKL